MSNMILSDALQIKKLVREAEALSDEAMLACSKLKQAMLKVRQNPDVPVDTGQRAILRLTQAEQQALSMSTNLLRVHDELSKIARVNAVGDTGMPTDIPADAVQSVSFESEREPA